MSTAAASHAMAASTSVELFPVLALLGATVIAVPLFKHLGLGTVLGYLVAGLIVGPFGFAIIQDPHAILHIAELGIVMFLFVIGLEMQPARLWSMRGEIFGLGFAQAGACSIALTTFGMAIGYSFAQSFVGGTGFVLTSTAIVMQILEERHVRGLPRGRRTIAILLLEDLAIVPLLGLVALLAPEGTNVTADSRINDFAVSIGSIVGLVLAGRYLLNPLFKVMGSAHARDLMTAAALLVVLGAAYLMQLGGLSMAMGAFLAGVLLSESSFRHQLEADIEPFRGVLLGLFFLSVGMALNLTVIAENWTLVIVLTLGYMVVKMLVIYIVARTFKLDSREAVGRSVLMAQGGEFAFVLYSAATMNGIISAATNAIFTSAIIASMVLTPILILFYDFFMPKFAQQGEAANAAESLSSEILLIGFGRFGQIVSQPLLANGYSVSIIETSTTIIFDLEPFGFKVYYGDGSRLDVLHAAGAPNARLIVVAIDDRAACLKIVEIIKGEFPKIPVLARAYDREHAIQLVNSGVDWHIRETFESALSLGEKALELLEPNVKARQQVMEDIRRRDLERLKVESTRGIHATHDLIWTNKNTRKPQE